MAETQILPVGTLNTPADVTLDANQTITPEVLFAHFNGAGAAGSYVPTVEIISDSGATVLEVAQDSTIAAGTSVEASWAPFLKTASSGTPTPPVAPSFKGVSISQVGQVNVNAGVVTDLLLPCSNFSTSLPTYFQDNAALDGFDCLIASNLNVYGVVRIFSNDATRLIPTTMALGVTRWATAGGTPGVLFVGDQTKVNLPAGTIDNSWGAMANFFYWMQVGFTDLAVQAGQSYGLWLSALAGPKNWIYGGGALFFKRFSNFY